MAKAFKILVDIIIVLCILSVVALIVPSLVGVNTDIVGPKMDSNLQEGTVTYGVRRPVGSLIPGDEIIYAGDNYLYLFTIQEVDSDNGEVYALDPATAQTNVLPIKKNTIKKVLVVPFLGYLMIATRSINGMGMLISAALVLIALFIVAEVWYRKARREKRRAYSEEDDDYFTALAQSMEKPGSLDSLNRAPQQEPQTFTEAVSSEEAGMTIKIDEPTGAVSEQEPIQELILEPVAEESDQLEEAALSGSTVAVAAASDFDSEFEEYEITKENAGQPVKEETKPIRQAAEAYKNRVEAQEAGLLPPSQEPYDTENIVAAFAEIPDDDSAATLDMRDDQIPDVSDALVAALDTTQVSRSDRTYQPVQPVAEAEPAAEEVDEIELAIPVRTVDEILEDAYAKGYDPLVTTDDVTGVKLVDFSDCL